MTQQILESTLTPELKKHIYKAFDKYAIKSIGINGFAEDPIAFEIKEGSTWIGCIVVHMYWGQLHIKYLIVDEAYRNLGYARQLMEHTFKYGRNRGCSFAFVETMSFQAPKFYQKLGFKVDFVRNGYDKGTSFYYLTKGL